MSRLLPQPAHELDTLNAAMPMLANYPERELDLIKKAAMSAAAAIPPWPSYTGVSQLVGASPSGKVTVYVDPSLGVPAMFNATDLIANADTIVAKNDGIFGAPGGNVNVILFALGGLTNGQGGADHLACDYMIGQNLEVCVDFGQPIRGLTTRPDPEARVTALFEAELSECSMKNKLCGLSTGEALSRWCAITAAGNVLKDFQTSTYWLFFGMHNLVDTVVATDRDRYGNGCGMVFLSWLQSHNLGGLGIPLPTIAQKMVALGDAGTLADLYAGVTSKPKTAAWPDFQAAIKAAGGTAGLLAGGYGDDVFNVLNAPPAHPGPPPKPVPPIGTLPPIGKLPPIGTLPKPMPA